MAESLIKLECNLAEAFKSNEENTVTLEILSSLDKEIELLDAEIIDITKIEKMHPDKLDIAVAVSSGVLSALIDSVFVGEFDLNKAHEWGKEKVEKFVRDVAKDNGFKGNTLSGAVKNVEKRFAFVGDKLTDVFGGGTLHHLNDCSHHASLFGLICSICMQFFGTAYGTTKEGTQKVKLEMEADGVLIGRNPFEKIMLGTVNWFFHLVSDMAGSSSTAGKTGGTGIPGPILSFAKVVSGIFGKDSKVLNDIFKGKIFEAKFDLRTEIGLPIELIKQQSMPVIINESIVKSFIVIRAFVEEVKKVGVHSIEDLKKIDLKNVFEKDARKTTEMLTYATGAFFGMDLVDAAIQGAINAKGCWVVAFLKRVNIVGLSQFAIKLSSNLANENKYSLQGKDKKLIISKKLHLLNAKLFYRQELVWEKTKETQESIVELSKILEEIEIETQRKYAEIDENIRAIQALELTKETQELLIEELDI